MDLIKYSTHNKDKHSEYKIYALCTSILITLNKFFCSFTDLEKYMYSTLKRNSF